jgi:HPt (histidine-containing phosphotransfer) domain-containing protein
MPDKRPHTLVTTATLPEDERLESQAPAPARLVSDYATEPEMQELITLFVKGLPAQVLALDEAMQRGDAASITRLAHQLKGAAGGYGFPTITDAAGRVECVANDNREALAEELAKLSALCARTQA